MIFVALQANWSLGADHLMSTTWDADLPDLTLFQSIGETPSLLTLQQPMTSNHWPLLLPL